MLGSPPDTPVPAVRTTRPHAPAARNITAQQGSGNLLGNLLCAVANLLNGTGGGGGVTTAAANLLNQILGAL